MKNKSFLAEGQEGPVDLFDYADSLRYGELHMKADPSIGLRAIVAVHNLSRGPAIGGCRFIEYDSTDDALRDAMRLARGMTYKAAISGLDHGGGKAVIVRPKGLTEEQRAQIFHAFGAFVDELGGKYITCEDSGTRVSDMNIVHEHTRHVLGFDPSKGSSGDPSPFTAFGVRRGIQAAVKFKLGRDDLEGLHVAVQGVGNVGYHLARELHELGARLTVTDVSAGAIARCVKEFGAAEVAPGEIYGVDCDIFAPCALGAVINDHTIPQLKCSIVAGASNNQLAEDHHGEALRQLGITYAPDYAINAGGLINVAEEYVKYDAGVAREKCSRIYDTIFQILERAKAEEQPEGLVADRIVDEMIFG
jgi:leucine dehydrogenase